MSKGYNITVRQEEGTWVARVYTVDSITELQRVSSDISAERAVSLAVQLEYLREQLRAETMSYSELYTLQSLAEYIDPGDVELLEAAGVPEFEDEDAAEFDEYIYDHVTPYTGHPFTDNCDCCGRWGSLITHVATNGWRYCDRCTDHCSFGTESAV